jgi:ABC-2 type transport system ATP-binding protein
MNTIEVRDLRVSYGSVQAVDGIDLTVREGEVFALLGPNGAGKTTTVEVLEGFRNPRSGEIRVLGEDPRDAGLDWRRQLGIVLQETAVEPYLTVREVLRRNQAYYDHPLGIDDTIERVGLTAKADARIRTLSGGQQRRLDVALGIIGRPRLLFLDEPTTGFDPGARRGAWDLVRSLRDTGTTIVLTTHYMDEAQALADRLAVIAYGRIVAEGTPADIGGRDHAAVRIRFALPTDVGIADLPVAAEADGPGRVIVLAEEPAEPLHRLTGWLLDHGYPLDGLTVDRPTLEDTYLELTAEHSA